jgi:hypothetical protein
MNQEGVKKPTFTDFLLDETRVSDDDFRMFMDLVEHDRVPIPLMTDDEQKRLMPDQIVQNRRALPSAPATEAPLAARDSVMSAPFGELQKMLAQLSAQYPQG